MSKKKFVSLIVLLALGSAIFLGQNQIKDIVNSRTTKIFVIEIAKVITPFKNIIMFRDTEKQIVVSKTTGNCNFCNFSDKNLSHFDLSNIEFKYSNFNGANLSGSNLSGVNLTSSNLIGANLNEANLMGSNLYGSNLSSSTLENANLNDATLIDANLSNIDFKGANFVRSNLSSANLNNSNLFMTNLEGATIHNPILKNTILTNANLADSILTNADLSYKDLSGVTLIGANLSSSNLMGVDLSYKDLSGVKLIGANLSSSNLTGVDLSYKDLTGANLSNVDLSNTDLTGTTLKKVNLTNANLSNINLTYKDLTKVKLDGINLRYKDLTGANLTDVDLSNTDLTGTILNDAMTIDISTNQRLNENWINELKDLNVTRYDFFSEIKYIATKEGYLFQLKNNKFKLVLNLNESSLFPFFGSGGEAGILGVASKNSKVYISYSSQDISGSYSVVVDEYSDNFSEVKNIIKIDGFQDSHFGGSLLFDNNDFLYLSVGDGEHQSENALHAQNLNSLKGKILRFDLSKKTLTPDIVAYGIRQPWGVSIDSNNRMFILQCGSSTVEALYILDNLNLNYPVNLGWPVFEGSMKMMNKPLNIEDIQKPIFETKIRPGCFTAGAYIEESDSFVFADWYGTIRILKQKNNGDWYLIHDFKQENKQGSIWGFGLDKSSNEIYIAPKNLILDITFNKITNN